MTTRRWLVYSLAVALLVVASSPADEAGELLPMPKAIPAPESACGAGCTKACVAGKPLANSKEREIERSLQMLVTVQFKNMPLRQVIDQLRGMAGINIVPDQPALEEQAISVDRPVTISLEKVSLKNALALVLRQVNLTYVIRDEALQITTPEKAKGKLVQKTYAVADLVVPLQDPATQKVATFTPESQAISLTPAGTFTHDLNIPITVSSSGPSVPPFKAVAPDCKPVSTPKSTEDILIQTIVNTVSPQNWSSAGGSGTVDYFPLGYALVINQTADIHEQVAELLAALRRLQDIEVAVETRLLTTADDGLLERCCNADNGMGIRFLDADQVYHLLDRAQKDPRTNALQAPKVTVFNGQAAELQLQEKQCFVTGLDAVCEGKNVFFRPRKDVVPVGLRIALQPTCSADHRFVRLSINVASTVVASAKKLAVTAVGNPRTDATEVLPPRYYVQLPQVSTQTASKCLSIPVGSTAVFKGWTSKTTGRNEYGPPILSKIPWVNRAFKNTAYDELTQTTYVLVTPRIIVNEEQTVKVLPNPLPQQLTKVVTALTPACCGTTATPSPIKTAVCCQPASQGSCQRCSAVVAPTSYMCSQFSSQAHVGKDVPVKNAPKERKLVTSPKYVIQPPDIILVEMPRSLPEHPIAGERLVKADGTIGLGRYGDVRVAGLTVEQAKEAIQKQLSTIIREPQVNVDVYSYNSTFYYVIYDGAGYGESVARLSFTGRETVYDAVAAIGGIPTVSSKRRIWVARPAPNSPKCAQILPVDWEAIVKRGETATNYQLLPGDRLYIQSDEATQTGYTAPSPIAKEVKDAAGCQRCSAVVAPGGDACGNAPPSSSKHVTQLLQIYRHACAQGQRELARKLALLAIDMDPTCFGRVAGAESSAPR